MKRSSIGAQPCPVARAAAQLVDAWTFVILRELFIGNRRFEGLRRQSGMSPRSLTLRLTRLVEQDILERVPCADAPAFQEYRLTPKGLDLWPAVMMLRQWGERWGGPWGPGGVPLKVRHRGHDHALRLALVCATCDEAVQPRDSQVEMAPRLVQARAGLAAKMAGATARSGR